MVLLFAVPAAVLPFLVLLGAEALRIRADVRRDCTVPSRVNVVALSGRRRKGAHRASDRRPLLATRAG